MQTPIGKNQEKSNLESEGARVTGDTFLAVMKNVALRHVPVGTVFQFDGAQPHLSRRVCAF
jgi:hypothetical protein